MLGEIYPSLAQEKPSLKQKGRDNLRQENLKYLVKYEGILDGGRPSFER